LYVTNDHYIRAGTSPFLSKIETFSGVPGGTVVYIDTRRKNNAKIVARVPFANGITRLDKTTLAVASTSKSGIYLFEIKADNALELKKVVRTAAAVDNLSIDSEGKVLMAGHPFAPALMKVSQGRARCDANGSVEEKEACNCTAPSWVAEWSEQTGLKELYKDSGLEFCSSSTAVRDVGRGVGIVSGLYERGILVFQT
jgi:arylesterase/paraoxonase